MGSYGNFIYVSVNFRMHSFGFLSTEDENAMIGSKIQKTLLCFAKKKCKERVIKFVIKI